MSLSGGLMMFVLWGCASCAQYRADFNMAGVTGSTLFDSAAQQSTVNLTGTGTCRLNISLTTFPVIYGQSASPCLNTLIGNSVYSFSVNASQAWVSLPTLFEQFSSLDGLSVVVRTCNGTNVCAGLMSVSTVQMWQARFFTPVAGNVYIRQGSGESGVRVLSDLRNVDPTNNFTSVVFYFGVTCNVFFDELMPPSITKAGLLNVGPTAQSVQSRLELTSLHTEINMALLKLGSSFVCAQIRSIPQKVVSAVFNMRGITGYLLFTQASLFGPTSVTVNLTNLNRRVGPYHIHQFPIPQMRFPPESTCSNDDVGGHLNPFNVNVTPPAYPPPIPSTYDLYEMGDLSSRHGSLENSTNFQTTYTDWNLPLFGVNSIVGRSVVLHQPNGTRFACAGIGYSGQVIVAKALFRSPVVGSVLFTQLGSDSYSDVSVFAELSYGLLSTPSTQNHTWHIHVSPISTETDNDQQCCVSTGGHWNPFNVNSTASSYTSTCGLNNPFACEMGDLSGKYQTLGLQSNGQSIASKTFFTDTTSWVPGMIGLSLVVHGPNQTTTRLACANITLVRFPTALSNSWLGPGSSEGEVQFSTNSPQGPTTLSVSLTGLNSQAAVYRIHVLPINSSVNPCSSSNVMGDFDPFLVNETLSPAPGNGTVDQYEIGDISGKFGLLSGQNNFQNVYLDANLPLSGPNSIIGRSLVIDYTNGSSMRCADITPGTYSDGNWVMAEAEFSSAVNGTVMMLQQSFPDGSFGDTIIEVNVWASHSTNLTMASWFIAEGQIGPNGSCPVEAEMFDPFNMTGNNGCFPFSSVTCEIGNMTGRLGPVSLNVRQLFSDSDLQLTGDFTVVNRAMVFRLNNGTTGCANILPESPSATQMFPNVTSFSRYQFRESVADVLKMPISRISILPGSPSTTSDGQCEQVNFMVSGEVSSEKLKSVRTSHKMGVYKETKTCAQNGGTALMLDPLRMLLIFISTAWCLLGSLIKQ